MRKAPKIDPTTIGISFVDILFALVVGQVLDPVARWVIDPTKNALISASFMHLGVALVLTITSWVGYHNSANRARFQLRFVNVELIKFTLDIAMVVLYFMLAAYALRTPLNLRPETVLVFAAFGLYALWDLAGVWEKRTSQDNPYKAEWNRVLADATRVDIVEDWAPTNWFRVAATFLGLLVTGCVFAIVWFGFARPVGTPETAIVVDSVLLVILVLYRMLKDLL